MFRVHDFPINAYVEAMAADYRRQGYKADFEPFAYNAEFLPVIAGASAPFTNATDQDSSFICFYQQQSCYSNNDAGYVPFPNALVTITVDATGRAMMDRPTHILNIFGRAGRPFPLIRPFVIGPKSSWTTVATNADTFDMNLRLCFWGLKVYLDKLQ